MEEKLPPYDQSAEASLLAAILEDPTQVVPNARRRFGPRKVFYDVRHATIWNAFVSMADVGRAIDLVTLNAYLTEHGILQDAGGSVYLAELSTPSGSPANWPAWCDIIVDRWTERQLLAHAVAVRDAVNGGVVDVDQMINQSLLKLTDLGEARRQSTDEPPRVKRPKAWAEKIWDLFYGSEAGEPGSELPFGYPWKVRPSELTLAIGDTGNGKTTFLSFITMHMLARGWKGFIAYMEERPEASIRMMISQLIGTMRLAESDADRERLKLALEWYQQRLAVYDFLGIVDWHVLIQAMEHAAERLGCNFFVIDSLMRLGIADDDYPEQGRCVMALAGLAHKYRAHVVLVNHLNKSDRETKSRQRGSQQIVDNANNVIEVRRNEKKMQKICEIRDKCKQQGLSEEAFKEDLEKVYIEWDADLRLLKQRWQGSQQNASKKLWFRRDALQFTENPKPIAVDYLSRWRAHPLKQDAPQT